MAVRRPLFTDEGHATLQATASATPIRMIHFRKTDGKMSYGLNKTLQMCTVKIESGLGYKSSQVRVQVYVLSLQVQFQQKWT